MILIEIDGLPIPWKSHGGYGRRSFNPRYKERECFQWQIKTQFNQGKPICGPVRCLYTFHMPIPKTTSKIRRLQMLNDMMHHIVRPDATNLIKMYEDCLKGIIFEDDSQVVEIFAKKIYGERPKTIIKIEAINEKKMD